MSFPILENLIERKNRSLFIPSRHCAFGGGEDADRDERGECGFSIGHGR